MPNARKKSIADLIGTKSHSKKPSVAEIDKITSKIHEPQNQAKQKAEPLPLPVTEKVKRISVNAPVSLYLKAKTKATLQDQTLMAYIMRLIEEDVKN